MSSPSLNSKGKPGWFPRLMRGIAARIDPELYEQSQGVTMTRYGLVKSVGGKFGEIDTGNQFVMERPGGHHIDPEKALANNRGYVYAAVNAKAREVQNIDFRLFQVNGEDHNEKEEHPLLDLLDGVNPDMIGAELKYLTSSHLDLVGNCYWLLTDKRGNPVKDDLTKPDAIYILDPSKIHPVIDKDHFPYRIQGYKMKLESRNIIFDPSCIIHFRTPDPMNFFEGRGIVQAGAEYIDNDNYAMEFNRKFFVNGARPAGFLETEMVSETQVESLKIGFMDVHGGIDNMNRIGVLPKGVKWAPAGASPKDMDFKNLSEDMRDRILALFGVSKTILGTAESDTNRATAETADYVFSKRVVKPHMQRICDFLNEKLVPRYGDNLYISFIDPVPEDRGARTTEMQASVGSQPVLTINEARDEFMGLGPVEGGDVLMAPSTIAPVGEPQGDGDVSPESSGGNDAGKMYRKAIEAKVQKAANGQRVAFRLARTKLTTRAKQRGEMADALTKTIAENLKKRLEGKKFETTKEQDDARWKEWSEYTAAAEKEIAEAMRKINGEQKKEVLANLPAAISKAVDPKDLFSIDKWISITTEAITPIMETLFDHQARSAAAEIGKPELNPFNDTTRAAVKAGVQKMSESYNGTTLEVLETKINDGLQSGASLADIDPNQDVHFFLGDVDDGVGEGGVAPIVLNTTGGNSGSDIQWNSLDVDVNITNMQNSVFVIGGTYTKTFTASTTPDTFMTDGVAQFFSVSYAYEFNASAYETTPMVVTLNGVSQTIGVANQDDPASFQVMYNDQQRWIQFTGGAPSSGQTVKVFGSAKVPIVAHAYDSSSIGTYGEYQGVVTDSKITSVPEAQARAEAQILQFGHPVYDVKFNTLVPGCAIGQALTVDLPAFGIDEQLIIKRIEAVGYVPGANGMLQYQIEAIGSNVVTFTDLMQTVLQQEANQTAVDDSTILEDLVYAAEGLELTDSVSATSGSSPYVYGPSSPQARYGFAKYS